MNNWFKQNGMHFAIIGIFLAICFFYFTPAFNGKTLGQSDVVGAQSTQKEINDYRAKGETKYLAVCQPIKFGHPTAQTLPPG
jgi:hypothetical protein